MGNAPWNYNSHIALRPRPRALGAQTGASERCVCGAALGRKGWLSGLGSGDSAVPLSSASDGVKNRVQCLDPTTV